MSEKAAADFKEICYGKRFNSLKTAIISRYLL